MIGSDLVVVATIAGLATLLSGAQGTFDGIGLAHAPATVLAVAVALPLRKAWSMRVLGEGAEEFRRLGSALLHAAFALMLAAAVFPPPAHPLIRGDVRLWVFVVIPSMAAVLMLHRYLLRRLLHRARRHGRCMLPVVAAGGADSVRDFITRTREQPHVGWRVEAACLVPHGEPGEIDGVAVVGGLDALAERVRMAGYRVVAVTSDSYWTPRRLQELAWQLEETPAELVVAPVLMEVGGPRLDVSGVLGMPMVRVAPPTFTGVRRVVKEVFDRVGAALLLLLAWPAMLAVAAAIKLTDGGPVFYRQRRVKRHGETFRMWKFRTMVVGAEAMRAELAGTNDASGPLFKLREDPRVTRVGALLRRFSLDELPQLFNVLGGSMSLVGPRPPLPEEIASYGPDAGRRLLVKPGITGLWQVSGRSDLSWAESVRLDLRYVEDWSLALDAAILWKTARAVLRARGAY